MDIHQTAIISPKAKIGEGCKFGPYCIVEDDVEIGGGCVFNSFSVVKSGTVMGSGNHVFEGAVVGGHPQYRGLEHTAGKAVIGDNNQIRENCTIHRSIYDDGETRVGSGTMLMANVHVAHDCVVGDNVLISNNTMLAGHVTIEDRAVVSGAVGIHQFCRVGTLAMVGGQAHVAKDIPPYMLVDGETTKVAGLNLVGLQRANFSAEDIKLLKKIYRLIYRSGLPWTDILSILQETYTSGPGYNVARFLAAAERGIVQARRHVPTATKDEDGSAD